MDHLIKPYQGDLVNLVLEEEQAASYLEEKTKDEVKADEAKEKRTKKEKYLRAI